LVIYAHGHPLSDKHALAAWMKYPSAEAMDADHDGLHEKLCEMFSVPSYSLRKRDGGTMTEHMEELAACEEAAILHVQRWLQWMKVEGWHK
jgi:hypothetical protein